MKSTLLPLLPLIASAKCYADSPPSEFQEIDGCECHSSCMDCGYSSSPTFANDCISCPRGFAIFSLYDDGTGYCVKTCNSLTGCSETEFCNMDTSSSTGPICEPCVPS